MEHAFLTSSNRGMTATDTQKNTVYYIAKQMKEPCSPEEFALALAKHFVDTYPLVSKAKVTVEAQPWKRVGSHEHGFAMTGTEVRTAYVTYAKGGVHEITAGLKDLRLLKTTQSGYSGFIHDKLTSLPDVSERMVASAVTASWRYSHPPPCFDTAYEAGRAGMLDEFFGPPKGGIYSPSVQYTLFRMGKSVLDKVPEAASVFLNMPNLHFLPTTPLTSKFEDDVYTASSEPHGNIEAVVTRGQSTLPHCRL